MPDFDPDWRADLRAMRANARLWLRPDPRVWIRPDADRFMPPGWREKEAHLAAIARGEAPAKAAETAPPPMPARRFTEAERQLLLAMLADSRAIAAELRAMRETLEDKALHPNGYDPAQPRWPAGTPGSVGGQWSGGAGTGRAEGVQVAGPPTSTGRSRLTVQFPGATPGQMVRFEIAVSRTQGAQTEIRRIEPRWKPTTESLTSRPEGVEGAIAREEARAREAEDHLRELRRHNGGPPLEGPPGSGSSALDRLPFDGTPWINMYRAIHDIPDRLGNSTWPNDKGTVAIAEIDGQVVVGTNSKSPGYTGTDWDIARRMRDNMVIKYSAFMQTENAGRIPNDALFHAESTILLRAARAHGGTLSNRAFEVHVDRAMCPSCEDVIPLLGLELGNPVVTFVNTKTGRRQTMFQGTWIRRDAR